MRRKSTPSRQACFDGADTLEDTSSLLCIGQGQQPLQGIPSLCPPAEGESQSVAAPQLQQPGASAELVDGHQLHITGDAMDALQSPVCASAQVMTHGLSLTGFGLCFGRCCLPKCNSQLSHVELLPFHLVKRVFCVWDAQSVGPWTKIGIPLFMDSFSGYVCESLSP